MKIEVLSKSYEQLEKEDYDDVVIIEIDGVVALKFQDGAVEENHLGENFKDVYKITDIAKMIHAAGLRGEPLEIIYTNF